MERSRLKEEQEKRLQDERTKFIEKTKNLLIFEPVEDDKPKRSTAPAKVQGTHAEPALIEPVAASWACGCHLVQLCVHSNRNYNFPLNLKKSP